MELYYFENFLKNVFPAVLIIAGIVTVIMIIGAVCECLKDIWREKHVPRRQTLTYEDIANIFSHEISLLPYGSIFFEDYRAVISHLEKIIKGYSEVSENGKIPKIIEKHVESSFFNDIEEGRKRFEIRRDRDDIQPGDILVLREVKYQEETGRVDFFRVKGVFRDGEKYGLKRGYCIISI